MKTFLRWAADWRTVAAVSAAALVAYLGVLVVTSIQDRGRAIDAATSATASEREARKAASRRIDQLLAQIAVLQQDAQSNGQQLVLLREELSLLQQQVRELGGQPIVIGTGGSSGSATASPRPHSSSSADPTPKPSPTHVTPRPSPSASRTCVLVICI